MKQWSWLTTGNSVNFWNFRTFRARLQHCMDLDLRLSWIAEPRKEECASVRKYAKFYIRGVLRVFGFFFGGLFEACMYPRCPYSK
jgi:hypothetical protein